MRRARSCATTITRPRTFRGIDERSSLTFSLCLTSVLLASCGEAKVAAKIKPEEFELGGTLQGRSVKACAEDGWHACLFLKRMFVPGSRAEIGGNPLRRPHASPKTPAISIRGCERLVISGSRLQLPAVLRVAELGAVGESNLDMFPTLEDLLAKYPGRSVGRGSVAASTSSIVQRADVVLGVELEAELVYEVELGFEKIDMLLLLMHQF